MKDMFSKIIDEYLAINNGEEIKLSKLKEFIDKSNDEDIYDWNNFNGHVVASAFIYAKKEKKLLLVYHNDFKIYLYPGGHMESCDKTPLDAAIREIKEETGIINLEYINVSDNELVPIDIDIHEIEYNELLDLPEHYHYDFRYLFYIDEIRNIILDTSELSDYKWASIDEVENQFGGVLDKIKKVI